MLFNNGDLCMYVQDGLVVNVESRNASAPETSVPVPESVQQTSTNVFSEYNRKYNNESRYDRRRDEKRTSNHKQYSTRPAYGDYSRGERRHENRPPARESRGDLSTAVDIDVKQGYENVPANSENNVAVELLYEVQESTKDTATDCNIERKTPESDEIKSSSDRPGCNKSKGNNHQDLTSSNKPDSGIITRNNHQVHVNNSGNNHQGHDTLSSKPDCDTGSENNHHASYTSPDEPKWVRSSGNNHQGHNTSSDVPYRDESRGNNHRGPYTSSNKSGSDSNHRGLVNNSGNNHKCPYTSYGIPDCDTSSKNNHRVSYASTDISDHDKSSDINFRDPHMSSDKLGHGTSNGNNRRGHNTSSDKPGRDNSSGCSHQIHDNRNDNNPQGHSTKQIDKSHITARNDGTGRNRRYKDRRYRHYDDHRDAHFQRPRPSQRSNEADAESGEKNEKSRSDNGNGTSVKTLLEPVEQCITDETTPTHDTDVQLEYLDKQDEYKESDVTEETCTKRVVGQGKETIEERRQGGARRLYNSRCRDNTDQYCNTRRHNDDTCRGQQRRKPSSSKSTGVSREEDDLCRDREDREELVASGNSLIDAENGSRRHSMNDRDRRDDDPVDSSQYKDRRGRGRGGNGGGRFTNTNRGILAHYNNNSTFESTGSISKLHSGSHDNPESAGVSTMRHAEATDGTDSRRGEHHLSDQEERTIDQHYRVQNGVDRDSREDRSYSSRQQQHTGRSSRFWYRTSYNNDRRSGDNINNTRPKSSAVNKTKDVSRTSSRAPGFPVSSAEQVSES